MLTDFLMLSGVWKPKHFFVKLYIIFALKYNKQQLLLLLDKINPKILGMGGHYYGRPPS